MERPIQELTALLEYMVKHNQDHAAELQDLAARAQSLGKSQAYKHIARGINLLKESNESLSAALKALGD